MADASLVLDAIVAVSIAAGAFFAVVELRSLSKDRRTELIMRMNEHWSSKDFEEAWIKVRELGSKDPGEMEKRCSKLSLWMVVNYFDGIGDLAQENLIDREFVLGHVNWIFMWERLEPWVLDMRQKMGNPCIGRALEWAAAEMRERDLLRKRLAPVRPS